MYMWSFRRAHKKEEIIESAPHEKISIGDPINGLQIEHMQRTKPTKLYEVDRDGRKREVATVPPGDCLYIHFRPHGRFARATDQTGQMENALALAHAFRDGIRYLQENPALQALPVFTAPTHEEMAAAAVRLGFKWASVDDGVTFQDRPGDGLSYIAGLTKAEALFHNLPGRVDEPARI